MFGKKLFILKTINRRINDCNFIIKIFIDAEKFNAHRAQFESKYINFR